MILVQLRETLAERRFAELVASLGKGEAHMLRSRSPVAA
jgi:hypothetical protein